MKFLITGAAGMLGRAVAGVLAEQRTSCIALDRAALDVTDANAVREAIAQHRPGMVVHCAAYTRVDDAESDEARAFDVNAAGAAHVAAACRAIGARLIYPSTDYVFDGRARTPYAPGARAHPLNAYGRSKLAGEIAAREAGDHLVVRTSWLYGTGGRNFVGTIAQRIAGNESLRVVNDQRGAPSWAPDVARTLLALATHATPGTWHAANSGSASWYELAVTIATLLGVEAPIEPCPTSEFPSIARRPAYSVLDCRNTDALVGPARHWQAALEESLRTHAY